MTTTPNKRFRTSRRLLSLMALAIHCRDNGYTGRRLDQAIERWVASIGAIRGNGTATARSEARRITQPNALPLIERNFTEALARMAGEPVDTKARLYHVFIGLFPVIEP